MDPTVLLIKPKDMHATDSKSIDWKVIHAQVWAVLEAANKQITKWLHENGSPPQGTDPPSQGTP